MKFWIIAWKDVTIRLRDRKGLLTLFLMPLVLTLILGAALGGVFSDSVAMPKMTLAVYNGDDGDLGKTLTEDVLQNENLRASITVKSVSAANDVSQKVAAGQADAGIVIPQNFSHDVTSGQAVQIAVVQDPGKTTIASIVNSIVTSYSDRVSAAAVASKTFMTDVSQKMTTHPQSQPAASAQKVKTTPVNFGKITQELAATLKQTSTNPNVAVNDMPVGEKAISAKQYYSAGMAVMFLLFNATIGAKSILNERETETLARLMSTPTGKTTILLGKFTGTMIFAVLQFAVLLLATHFGFGVDWGSNLLQIGSIVLCYSIAVSGLSMTIAAVISSAQNADIISQFVIQIFSILGGSMVPLSVFPDLMRKISLVTPNAWALSSLTDIMTGTTWQTLWLPLGVLLAIGAAALTLGTWRLQAVRR